MANTRIQLTKKYHIIYKTTNLINQKFYIGAHSTDDLDDGYVGSGDNIVRAIKKYGKENFSKEILEILPNPESMFLAEASIVTPEFIKRKDVYNIIPGGYGGPNKGSTGMKHMHHPESGIRCAVYHTAIQKMLEDGWVLGRNMSSTTGTIWVHKMSEKKMIQKTDLLDYIHEGWTKGLPKSPTLGKTWIYNSSNDEYSLCNIDELDSKLAAGWVRKKWSPVKKGFKQEIVTCPHCNRTGGKNAMKHLHFDNCNKNPNNIGSPRKQRVVTCPHCSKTGGVSNMVRHHFDNCKLNPAKDGQRNK